MADETNPLAPNAQQPPTQYDYQQALYERLDSDPEYAQRVAQAVGPMPSTQSAEQPKSALGSLFDRLKAPRAAPEPAGGPSISPTLDAVTGFSEDLGASAGRGVAKAGNELVKFASEAAGAISTKTGLAEAVRTPEEYSAFRKWYDNGGSYADPAFNPMVVYDHEIDAALGPSRGGALGFVENVTQFAVGFALAGKALGPLSAGAGKLATAAYSVAQGGLTDLAFFDPHAERLSNLINDHAPAAVQDSFLTYLKANPDDTRAEGRLKNALEGFVIGGVLDGVVGGMKALKAYRDFRAGTISAEQADTLIREQMAKAKAMKDGPRNPGDFVTTLPAGRGRFKVVANDSPEAVAARIAQEEASKPRAPSVGVAPPEGFVQPEMPKDVLDHPEVKAALDDFSARSDARIRDTAYGESRGVKPLPVDEGPLPPVEVEVSAGAPKGADVLTEGEGHLRAPKDEAAHEVTFNSEAEAQAAAASVNQAVKNEAREALDYTPETFEAWKEVSKNPELLKDTSGALETLERYGFNPKYAQQPEDVVASAKAFVEVAGEAVTIARGRTVSNTETLEQAKDLFGAKSAEAVLNFAKGIWQDSAQLHVGLTALRIHTWSQLRSAIKLAGLADMNPQNVVAAEQAFKALDSFGKLQAMMTGTASNAGRALQSMQIPVGDAVETLFKANPEGLVRGAGDDAAAALKGSAEEAKAATPAKPADAAEVNAKPHEAPPDFSVIEGLTKEQAIALLRHASMVDNPESLIKLFSAAKIERAAQRTADKGLRQKLTKVALSYRMEAMLSGPLTQVVNTINNAMVAALRPVEMMAGGVTEAGIAKMTGGDAKAGLAFAQEGWDTGVALALHLTESARMAKLAYKSGKNILDPGASVVEEAARSGAGRTMQSWAGYVMPSRLLMTTDEFFKQLNYRANTRAQVLRYARERGITDAGRIKEMLDEGLTAAFAPQTGAGILPGPLEYSRVQTFSNELGEGTWGNSLANLKSKHVLAELALPFVKTPTNVFRHAWERAPILNALNKNLREDIAAGGARRAGALGKVEMGMLMYGSAIYLAHTGQITGAGPADPELRAQWKQAGYQPYSVKVGNRWVSYRRGDPVTTSLGLTADVYSMLGSLDERRKQNVAAAVIASITANVANKTYMQGLVEFTDAISSGRGSTVDHLLSNLAGSFIPNAARQLNPDDTIRETHGIIEELKSRVPGLSTTLEPKRNLFGEKLMLHPGQQRAWNPFTTSVPFKKHSVGVELVSIGKAFNLPEEMLERALDLTDRNRYGKDRKGQSPYDRMLQMMGSGEIGGAPLREKLEALVSSPEWQKMPADDDLGPGGMRYRVAARIIEAYQSAAKAKLFSEYPTLAEDYRRAKGRKYVGMAGGMDAVKQYEALFGLSQ